ncbi:SDR family NAD(P)-dependent oxidoreductase [Frateuria aurantia]
MLHPQNPIHSGFNATSTATQVLAGIDLKGTTALVTGGHSGLGLETTRALTRAGARVIVAARDPAAARIQLGDPPGVAIQPLDLADPASIQAFAQTILSNEPHIDILIGSAGIMACPETRVGPGWEAQLATNHLGHYALVSRLWPVLQGGARVVLVSSAGHRLSAMRWDDLQFTRGYDKWLAYGQSKTANVLCAVQLDRLGRSSGIRAFALHPGKILTPLQRHLGQDEMIAAGWLDAHGQPADPSFKSVQQGAATQVWMATSPQLAGIGGVYGEDCDIAVLAGGNSASTVGVQPYAIDPREAERLWAWSAEQTGLDVGA